MVLPAPNRQKITYSKIWRLIGAVGHLSGRLRNESENWPGAEKTSSETLWVPRAAERFMGAARSGWRPERRSGRPGSLRRGRACTAAGYWPPLAVGRHVSVLDRRHS